MRNTLSLTVLALAFGIAAMPAGAQTTGMSDSDYIAKIKTAAPVNVVQGANIVQMQANGSMKTIQAGTNGFTCMVLPPNEAMCADQNAMAWANAMMSKSTPPGSVGFVYMLAGDDGASNTDPWARAKTSDNHWVQTGPHVMITGSPVKTMGYPMTADADPTKPYVMWPDTPYAHLMIPVSSLSAATPPQ
ncbi:MAG TPA: hypothetical protein VHR97_07010 [Candidatus Baltobacteraceae bacterium]|jgi:hypothetical protein|nr:hypothetical protein [Candidatus Baltobacteraceae bacterium]